MQSPLGRSTRLIILDKRRGFWPRRSRLGRERTVDRAPVVVTEAVTLVTLDKKIVSYKVDLHIGFEGNSLHIRQAVDVGQQEPSRGGGQEVVDHVAFGEATCRCEDRVNVIVRRTRTQFRLGQTDGDRLVLGSNNQLTATSEDLQTRLILEVRADGDHAVEQGGLIEVNLHRGGVRNRATVDGVVGGAQSLAVTADGRIVRRSGVQHVCAVDFLRLLEGLDQAEVRRMELGLVQVVINRLASDGVAESDLGVLLIVDVAFASRVVEGGLAAFGLELGEAFCVYKEIKAIVFFFLLIN